MCKAHIGVLRENVEKAISDEKMLNEFPESLSGMNPQI
jgi:hypothetical protein